jgi:hypothetical protein
VGAPLEEPDRGVGKHVEGIVGIVDLIFVLVAAPVFFFILVWAVVSACRLLAPERPPMAP